MKKQVIRLTEGDLHRIIENSVKRILRKEDDFDNYESNYEDDYDYSNDENINNEKLAYFSNALSDLEENGETELFDMINQAYYDNEPFSDELIQMVAEKTGIPYEELTEYRNEFEEAAYEFI